MKFKKLMLKAFGPFTDCDIDLENDGEADGLHVIYGPNEGGKSSTLRAISAMLFGIERSPQDNFIHDNPQLRVGAEISNAGESIAFLRKKGNRATLLSAKDGEVLDDNCLNSHLNGSTKEMFFQEHAIDHDQLLAGGKALMANKGDVGQSLFSAGHGVVNLQNLVDKLQTGADALYTARKKKEGIPALIKEYKDIKKDEKTVSISTSQWTKIDKEYRNAEGRSAEVSKQRKTLEQEKNRLEALERTIPLIINRAHLLETLEEFADFTPVAMDVRERRKDIEAKITNIEEAISKEQIDIDSTEKQIAKITIPDGLLDNSSSINEIHQRLGSYKDAKNDKIGLESEKLSIENLINELLNDIETGLRLEEAQRFKLKSAERSEISELSEQFVEVESALKNSNVQLKKLKTKRTINEKALAELETAKEIGLLKRELGNVTRKGDLQVKLKKDEAQLNTKKKQLLNDYKQLGFKLTEVEEVSSIKVPKSSNIKVFQTKFGELKGELGKESDNANRFEEEIGKLKEALQKSSIASEEFGKEDLASARQQRQTGWKAVLSSWLEGKEPDKFDPEYLNGLPLQAAYERDLNKADHIADKRFDNAEAIAKVDNSTQLLEAAKSNLASTNEKMESLEVEQDALQERWLSLWKETGVDADNPEAMLQWLSRLEMTNDKSRDLQDLQTDCEQQKVEVSTCTKRLLKAINELSSEDFGSDDLNELVTYSGELVENNERLQSERRRLENQLHEISEDETLQRENVREQEKALEQWESRWKTLIVKHGFKADETTKVVTGILEQSREIFAKESDLNDKLARIEQIGNANESFEKELTTLLELAAPDLVGISPIEASSKLHEIFEKAKSDRTEKKALQEVLTKNDITLKQEKAALSGFENSLEKLCQQQGCASSDELRIREGKSDEFRELKSKISNVEEKLISTGRGNLEEIIKAAEGSILEDVESDLIDIKGSFETSEIDKSEIDQEIGLRRSQLSEIDGSDNAAKLADEAEVLITRLQKQSAEYITLTIALKILNEEIESFRKENETPLLTRANELFPQLTQNSFAGLEISYEGDEPMLVGVRQNGRHVPPEGMSDGTRDQMFLALRLAALEIGIEGAEPLPFIVDDILIQFDDDRARATLRVLKEVSKKTQILFFTHQARHVELVNEIGGIPVYELPDREMISVG